MSKSFLTTLQARIANKLPGKTAHHKMSPSRRFPSNISPNILEAKKGAVMILLYKKNNEWYIPIILRSNYDGVHSGQLSLPGGKIEPNDSSLNFTAMRETEEEIGIPKEMIQIIGEISPIYIPKSNFLVQPFIGYTSKTPSFIADPKEVEKIIELPLALLSDQTKKSFFSFKHNEEEIDAPCWMVEDEILWGATAMILAEFEEIVSKIN